MIEEKWLTMSEASKVTGCTTGYLRDLLRKDKLAGCKVGQRAWLIERQAAEALANKTKGVGRPRHKTSKKM